MSRYIKTMKDLENFLIDESASLKDALVKIKNNKSNINRNFIFSKKKINSM